MSEIKCVDLSSNYFDHINNQVVDKWNEVTGEKLHLHNNLMFYALVNGNTCIGFGGVRMRDDHLLLTKFHMMNNLNSERAFTLLLNTLLNWTDKCYGNTPVYVQLHTDSPFVNICKSLGFDRSNIDVIGITELCRGQKL